MREPPHTVLERNVLEQPDSAALIFADVRLSFAAFLERVNGAAAWLVQSGIRAGEVVGICIRDDVDHLVYAMALLCLGSPQIGLGAHEVGATKRLLAKRVGVTRILAESIEEWMSGFGPLVLPPSKVAPPRSAGAIFSSCRPDAVAVYSNTSGTTSVLKTFPVTFERLGRTIERYRADPKERRSLRLGSSEFDANRLNRLCTLLAGNVCIGLKQNSLGPLISLCEAEQVSALRIGPHRLESLLRNPHEDRRLPDCTHILASGSRVRAQLRRAVKARLSDNLWVQYSTSETGLVSIASPDDHQAFPEGVGFPADGIEVEILAENGEPARPGEVGRIRLRRKDMTQGYLTESEAQGKFQDGWFYPGDLLSRDPSGRLIFHGRADDVMILDGINVFPAAIEDTLESLPGVREAVAYPIKSLLHGEIPAAAVVLSAQDDAQEIAAMLAHCRNVLGLRAPRLIRVVEAIPRNAFGKPLRRELAQS